jgi:hypothetical protein
MYHSLRTIQKKTGSLGISVVMQEIGGFHGNPLRTKKWVNSRRRKMNPSNAKNTSHRIEPTLSILGTLVTLVITVVIWKELASTQGIWPLPALYFVEMISGAGLCSLTFLMGSYHATRIAWIYTGIVTGFMLLGAFSIGFFYFPVFLLYGGLAIYSGLKHKKNIFLHLGLWLGTGILQAGLMLAAIRIFSGQ